MTDRGTDDVTPRVRVTRAFSQLHDPAPRDHVPPLFANMPAPRSRGATHASARPTSPTSLPPPQRRKPALASSTTPSSSLKGTADAQQSTLPSRAPTTSAERPNGAESKFPNRGKVNQNLPLWPSLVWRVLYKEPFYKGGKVKKRVPGWCDRILIHSLLVSDSKLLPEKVPDPTSETASPRWIDNYRSVNEGDGMDVSDHSPVFGTFVLGFPRGETDALPSGTSRTLPHRKNRALSTLSNGRSDRYASCSVGGSYFDQARVVRQMKAHRRPVSTVLRVFNMTLSWHTHEVVPKKTRVVAPLVGEDAKQCDVIGERCHGANGLNLSLNAVMQHTRPLEQLHMLVWVKHETIHGHCTLSLKRIARQEEGNEVKFRVPLYHDSMRLHINGHPLVVVFSVRSKTFAK
ncbi:hypothetical protein PsorP6_000897 [Peronosclerospora sorghi]|uniref:Uncharacterized protein n=1 Tax=Peronosclerospora sorghi TaxID=230839 RepID=A0ACC0WWF2_9STRA|nr:hypothetical protein PsorP6_000897 [Peronosclerospora sorghi]